MLEAIGTAILIHLGKTAIDRFWGAQKSGNSSVVDQSGTLGYSSANEGRTVVSPKVTIPAREASALLFGDFYLFGSLEDTILGDEIALVLIVDETEQQTLLFDADVDKGYEVYLPPGLYSIFVFLVNPDTDSLFDTPLYAVGFPSTVDLTGIDVLRFEDPAQIWDVIDDSPIQLPHGRDYFLDFIFIDTEQVLGYPATFSDLLQSAPGQAADAVDLVTCPRCDGDGYVSGADLGRIRAMGHYTGDWGPGPCRLCDGKGLVSSDFSKFRDIGNTPREQGY